MVLSKRSLFKSLIKKIRKRSGVVTQIKSFNGKCLCTHCYGHALNLAIGDVIKSIPGLRETFETAREICKLSKISPQRDTKLDEIRSSTKNTRWTFRVMPWRPLLKIITNLWEWSLSNIKDTEMKARVRGVGAIMPTFDFLFNCSLGESILKQTDNLSKALQNSKTSSA